MRSKPLKGFTLIELLVVIAIIGILASVVLASLSTARGKASDANIQSNINGVRAHAEIYWDRQSRSYNALCNDATIQLASQAVTSAGGAMTCTSDATQFRISSPLVTDPAVYYCIDNNGAAGNVTTVPSGFVCS